ncbi:hypothetical protein PPYR_04861 [Photinus pyralis]|uniref:Uncharacterized protein n=1 Tax=Photinus pyralis TaxID=7054 RepID=A0A5N4AZA5_PHOPY|nr:uncharacterized protein LOC116164008 [Photinus pyralis]KAB0802675.1 hypothetical protein PPYR_04861 [Photinus pyralis]
MKGLHLIVFIAYLSYGVAETVSQPTPGGVPTAPQPVYQHPDKNVPYIPHATYPYAESFEPSASYEGYLMPNLVQYPQYGEENKSSVAKSSLAVMLKILAKVGLFLLGGVALLFVGGAFTTAVCSLTPICTITFNGFKGINHEKMRALVTPERVANAAAFVENAVDKYQRLQRAING